MQKIPLVCLCVCGNQRLACDGCVLMLGASDGDLTFQSDSLPSSVSVHVSVQEEDAPHGIMYSTASPLSQLSDR